MDNDNKNRGEKNPSAWLVTGGRMFKDRAFISEAGAIKSAQERDDGASVEPLYLDDQLPPAPVAEELKQPEGDPIGVFAFVRQTFGKTREFQGYLCNGVAAPTNGDLLYTHPQPAVDVDALAEFLEVSDFFGFSPAVARDLAMQICNWIEEQRNDQ